MPTFKTCYDVCPQMSVKAVGGYGTSVTPHAGSGT